MTKPKLSRVRAAIYRQPWMITDDGLDVICSVAENHIQSSDDLEHKARIERLEKEAMIEFMERNTAFQSRLVPDGMGGTMNRKFYDIKSGVGILRLTGPIFPRANMLTRMSG